MFKAFSIVLIFLCGNHWVSAQGNDIPLKEKELIQTYNKLTAARSGDFDSLNYFSDLFTEELKSLLSNPKTLKYTFKLLSDERICTVKTSKDKLFRIYSWDSQLGGTMRFFNVIYQYKTDNGVKTQSIQLGEGDPAWFCSDLFTLKTKKNTFYLAIINGIYSTKDVSQSIQAFELTNTGVNDSILLMKTSDGLKNSLDLAYDFFSVVDRSERPVAVIKYDTKKKIISISMTNEKGEIVSGYTSYQFNGSHFEPKQIKTKVKSQNAHSN